MSPDGLTVTLEGERAALARAQGAVQSKLATFEAIKADDSGADALSDEYIAAVVRGAVEKLQQDLVVFGRIDDDRPWRVGLYGIDEGGDQLVMDWRAPFATRFYQATFDQPTSSTRSMSAPGDPAEAVSLWRALLSDLASYISSELLKTGSAFSASRTA